MQKSKDQKKSKKKYVPKCSCGLEKEIVFEGDGVIQYPVFSCPEHGSSSNEWAKWWEKYKDRWQEEKYWNNNADKLSCLIGYFCNYYKKFYGFPYSFSFSSPIPYKDKDFIMGRRVLNMFEGDAKEAKVYIRWVFEKRVRVPTYPVYSVGFFVSQKFISEYKIAKERSKALYRSSNLPNDFINWCENNYKEIFNVQELKTWNDLNGFVTHIKTYGENCLEAKILDEAVKRNLLTDKYTYRKLEK